ncbi:hypothetical protein K439DRAFT_1525230 [Ramaria rubella]|nr:hypothetical protein K439DRAFT_1525230 [Ramaria rubella]
MEEVGAPPPPHATHPRPLPSKVIHPCAIRGTHPPAAASRHAVPPCLICCHPRAPPLWPCAVLVPHTPCRPHHPHEPCDHPVPLSPASCHPHATPQRHSHSIATLPPPLHSTHTPTWPVQACLSDLVRAGAAPSAFAVCISLRGVRLAVLAHDAHAEDLPLARTPCPNHGP